MDETLECVQASNSSSNPPPEALKQSYAALSAVPSTLRIPLAARAYGDALFPANAVHDTYAAATLAKLGDTGLEWLSDKQSIFGILARTERFKQHALSFMQRHPQAQLVNLGCGLSHYFQWLDNGQNRMLDADLPEVQDIRRTILTPKNARHQVQAVDLTAPDWWESLHLSTDQPSYLFSEGVLMYLAPDAVMQVLRTFAEKAPSGSEFAFDAMCWLAAGRAKNHPSVGKTQAEFTWGLRSMQELSKLHPRLKIKASEQVMLNYGWPYVVLEPMFRWCFGVPMYAVYVLTVSDAEEVK